MSNIFFSCSYGRHILKLLIKLLRIGSVVNEAEKNNNNC